MDPLFEINGTPLILTESYFSLTVQDDRQAFWGVSISADWPSGGDDALFDAYLDLTIPAGPISRNLLVASAPPSEAPCDAFLRVHQFEEIFPINYQINPRNYYLELSGKSKVEGLEVSVSCSVVLEKRHIVAAPGFDFPVDLECIKTSKHLADYRFPACE